MKCPNRRAERRPELLDVLRAKGYSRELDLSWGEQQGMFFEGTGERGGSQSRAAKLVMSKSWYLA